MIVEKGYFHFAEKYWGEPRTPGPPVPTDLRVAKMKNLDEGF